VAADPLVAARAAYAEELRRASGLRSERLVRAFAETPREAFVGPGPWELIAVPGGARSTADARDLYTNALVVIDPVRGINNGEPRFLARLVDALDLAEGERAAHIGCGVGYYTALIAAVVGPSGSVVAIEYEADLAERARENLRSLPWVRVVHGDGCRVDPGPVDAMLVNAGATHPIDLWLDRLAPGGRLVLPITGSNGFGAVLRFQRGERGFQASAVSTVVVYRCAGARDPEIERALDGAFVGSGIFGVGAVRSLRRDAHAPDETCWMHAGPLCLSTQEA
jgi:protein-L-isoaspartate(D-aspartate) O-methyltransferase